MKPHFISLGFLLVLLTACENQLDSPKPTRPQPIQTERGVANGTSISTIIGSLGGERTHPDGKIKVNVPACSDYQRPNL